MLQLLHSPPNTVLLTQFNSLFAESWYNLNFYFRQAITFVFCAKPIQPFCNMPVNLSLNGYNHANLMKICFLHCKGFSHVIYCLITSLGSSSKSPLGSFNLAQLDTLWNIIQGGGWAKEDNHTTEILLYPELRTSHILPFKEL
jgi:hypothetical protein